MPKMVCVKCETELKPEENGTIVVELFQENTEPYKVWSADKWKCPVCGIEVIAGFGNYPLMEHYEGDIKAFIEGLKMDGKEIVYDKER